MCLKYHNIIFKVINQPIVFVQITRSAITELMKKAFNFIFTQTIMDFLKKTRTGIWVRCCKQENTHHTANTFPNDPAMRVDLNAAEIPQSDVVQQRVHESDG